MAAIAKTEITISRIVDIEKVTRYYLLQSSTSMTPARPSANPPGGNWTTTEPAFRSDTTMTLYFADLTVMTNGTFSYSAVSKSSSYEAAKEAWNKANNAQNTADDTKDKLDNLQVGGRNLFKNSSLIGEQLQCSDIYRCNSCSKNEYTDTGYHIVTPSEGNDNNGVAFCFNTIDLLGLKCGDIITFSLEVKGTSDEKKPFIKIWMGKNSNWWTGDSSNEVSFIPTDDFQKVSVTWTIPDIETLQLDGSIFFGVHGNHQAELYFRKLKLELGNVATDWTPAPEDLVTTKTYESYIEKTDKTITLLAKQETVDAMNQRLSTAESTIKQFPDRIELKVDKDGIISAINQSAETVKIAAGKIDLSGYVTVSALSGNGTTTIDGSNIKTGTISADRLDIDSIFAKDITATGSITGVTLNGATGSFDGRITASEGIIGGFYINGNGLYSNKLVNNIQIHPLVIDNDGITCYGTYGYAYVKDGRIDLEHTMTTPIHAIGSLILSSDALGIQGSFTDQDHPEASSGFSISLDGDASFTNVQAPVELPDNGTNWIGGMTSTSCIVAPQQSSNLYHPVLRINSESNNVWNIGGYKDRVGIYGFKAERTANGYDFSTEWNTANGALSHSASFSAKGTITTESGDLVMGTGRSLRAKDEEGTTWNLIAMNEDSNISVGYGGYSMNYGTTTIYAGEKIGFALSLPETSWRPYFTEGDSVSIQFGTAGFTHNSGKSVTFVIPIAKPLVGVNTIVVTSVGGLTVRQENKLLYGATSSAGAKPASYAANAIHTHMGIKVTATMSNATNAMNNAPCGVYASVKITFN